MTDPGDVTKAEVRKLALAFAFFATMMGAGFVALISDAPGHEKAANIHRFIWFALIGASLGLGIAGWKLLGRTDRVARPIWSRVIAIMPLLFIPAGFLVGTLAPLSAKIMVIGATGGMVCAYSLTRTLYGTWLLYTRRVTNPSGHTQ